MQKREIRLIGVAIIIAALGIGAYLYLNAEESPLFSADPEETQDLPEARRAEVVAASTDNKPMQESPVDTSRPVEVVQNAAPEIDPLFANQQLLIKNFKDKVKLDVYLPEDMKFDEIELDAEVAAISGASPDKNMAVFAARTSASPKVVEAFLQEQKARIPMLVKYDFKISGQLQKIPPPKNSGISKITVIPGGENNGSLVYAALIERSDKKGSYLMLMEGSPAYFSNSDGDMDKMLSSLMAK